jgi:MFS family permease
VSVADESYFPSPIEGASRGLFQRWMVRASVRSSRLSRDLVAMTADGVGCSLMVGLGETYLAAFVLFLGMGGVAVGLLTTLPMLAGALVQLAAPWGVRRCGSHKNWVVATAALQGLSLLAVLSAERAGAATALVVFIAVTMYWAAGQASGPAWNTWVEEIVPGTLRARFFGRRQRFCQAALLAGFVTGGLALHVGASYQHTAAVFVGVFGLAAACRLFSAWCLAQQSAPAGTIPEQALSLVAMGRRLRYDAGGRLLAYLFFVQAVVQFSGPYFTPFMFRELGLSFFEYTLLIALAFVGKAIASPFYGRLAQRIGARKLLWIGGVGIVPVAGLWVISQSLVYLAVVQLLSGAVWAAYELAFFLMFFESIPRRERTSVLTFYNLTNSTAMVAGSLVGGAVLYALGASFNGYLMLFGLSSLGRLASLVLLFGLGRVGRVCEAHQTHPPTELVGLADSTHPTVVTSA